MPPSVSILSAGNGFHAKHAQYRIDLGHPNCRFPLFQLAYKPQSQTGTNHKVFLCESRSLPTFADELSDLAHGQHLLHVF